MTDPGGNKFHYLTKAGRDFPISSGTLLEEGYVVSTITAEAIHLLYPPLGTQVEIRIPTDVGASPSQ